MSQENVEIVRAAMDAWNRGDWDETLKHGAPDIVLDNSMNAGEWRGVHQGPDQVKRAFQMLTEAWQSVHIEISEFIDTGDFVVVALRVRARRRDIGVPFDMPLFHVFEMRHGKIQRGTAYVDKVEALEAVRLTE